MAVTIDTKAPLDRIISVLEGVDMLAAGLQRVYRGVPESIANQVSAYVYFMPDEKNDKNAGTLELAANYGLTFGYRVQGAEATAENVLCAVFDKWFEVFYTTERPGRLNGTCRTCELDFSRARDDLYKQVAAQEFRLIPTAVKVTLDSTL